MTSLAQVPPFGAADLLRGVARGLLLTWGLFWIAFMGLSAVGELTTEGLGASLSHAGQALVVFGVLLVAWRWEAPGGVVLIALALAMSRLLSLRDWRLALILLGPPAMAGLLLLTRAALRRLGRG